MRLNSVSGGRVVSLITKKKLRFRYRRGKKCNKDIGMGVRCYLVDELENVDY